MAPIGNGKGASKKHQLISDLGRHSGRAPSGQALLGRERPPQAPKPGPGRPVTILRARRPELTNWPPGTHKRTEQERRDAKTAEIRRSGLTTGHTPSHGDNGKQVISDIR
jgi:hypothetical protein